MVLSVIVARVPDPTGVKVKTFFFFFFEGIEAQSHSVLWNLDEIFT